MTTIDRSILLALGLTILLPLQQSLAMPERHSIYYPTAAIEIDESIVSASDGFSACVDKVSRYKEYGQIDASEIVYSISPRWGKIVRVVISSEFESDDVAESMIVCWQKDDGEIGISVSPLGEP